MSKLPAKETIVLTYKKDQIPIYIVTQNKQTQIFTLYSVEGKDYKKIKTGNSPLKFKEVYPDWERKSVMTNSDYIMEQLLGNKLQNKNKSQIRWDDMFYAVINAVKELDTKICEIVSNITDIKATIESQQKTIMDLSLDCFSLRQTILHMGSSVTRSDIICRRVFCLDHLLCFLLSFLAS